MNLNIAPLNLNFCSELVRFWYNSSRYKAYVDGKWKRTWISGPERLQKNWKQKKMIEFWICSRVFNRSLNYEILLYELSLFEISLSNPISDRRFYRIFSIEQKFFVKNESSVLLFPLGISICSIILNFQPASIFTDCLK